MAEVILVNCPISFTRETPSADETSEPPLGLMYIASYLEHHGISVKIFDPTAQRLPLPILLEKIRDEAPAVIGLSSLTSSLPAALELAKAIKERMGPKVPIGIGGPHVSVDPTFIHRFPIFDLQVTGEGEAVMLEIVSQVLEGKTVKGVYDGGEIEGLDALPFPARHLINVRDYHADEPAAVMIGSRGCPYRCSFCSIPGFGRKVRYRSARNIVDEMEKIYDEYNGFYSFVDDCFTLNRRHTEAFCRQIEARRLKVRWMAMTRADRVDEELVKMLAKSGCVELFFGVESGSERVRNQVLHKKISNEAIFQAVKLCKRYGIQASLFLMLGFPTETREDVEETVNFGAVSKADTVGIHLTMPLPGSEIFRSAIQDGIIPADIVDRYTRGELGDGFRDVWPAYIPEGMSKEELTDAKRRAYRKFILNPSWMMRRLYRDLRSPTRIKQDLKMVGPALYAMTHGGTKTSMS